MIEKDPKVYDDENNLHDTIPDTILCFSHLRWNFVFQRPQHLLTRLGKRFTIYYVEEPLCDQKNGRGYFLKTNDADITILTPHLPAGLTAADQNSCLEVLLNDFLSGSNIEKFIAWYYTPMALSFTDQLDPMITIYDCMDELSAFKFAPPELGELEQRLFQKADVVFTGGRSLYEVKKECHPNVHLFPSSIDVEHFGSATTIASCATDQVSIPSPILGFFGVIDERFDLNLISEVAMKKPSWQFVLIGPVVKIDPATLPKSSNIHYLGSKHYNDLPKYLSSWDIALIPFLLNESTRFISPTKTPEYLAAGIPVLSTPINDVVDPYGINGLVHIVKDAEEFIAAGERILSNKPDAEWKEKIRQFLSENSWDKTVHGMIKEIENITVTAL